MLFTFEVIIHTLQMNQKPHIVHVSKHFIPVYGGLERMIIGIIENTESHFTHEVLCYNTNLTTQNSLPKKEIIQGILINRMKLFKFGWFHFGHFPLSVIQKADIIHVHSSDLLLDYMVLLKIIFRLKAKIVVSTHGLIFHHQQWIFLKNFYMTATFFLKRKVIAQIFATGMSDYIYLKNYLNINKIILLENQLNHFTKIESNTSAKSGLITINRVQESKNIDQLLDVCTELRKQHYKEPICFLLSGNMDDFKHFTNNPKIEGLDIKLIFNCSDEEKWHWLAKAKSYISLSQYEGFGLAILEGLLSSCYVFIYQTVSINFDHHHFENLISFTENQTSLSIANTILDYSTKSPNQVKDEIIEKFNWSQQAKIMIAHYHKLLE